MIQSSTRFGEIENIEYFDFEEDFVEKNIRCIPMIIRLKMDTAGIKLKLSEWSHFTTEEKIDLAARSCEMPGEVQAYHERLAGLIKKYSGNAATTLLINNKPGWNDLDTIPAILKEKAKEFNWEIYPEQWKSLTTLQRFALLKLCRPGHENKNFPKAMKEFNLVNENTIN